MAKAQRQNIQISSSSGKIIVVDVLGPWLEPEEHGRLRDQTVSKIDHMTQYLDKAMKKHHLDKAELEEQAGSKSPCSYRVFPGKCYAITLKRSSAKPFESFSHLMDRFRKTTKTGEALKKRFSEKDPTLKKSGVS